MPRKYIVHTVLTINRYTSHHVQIPPRVPVLLVACLRKLTPAASTQKLKNLPRQGILVCCCFRIFLLQQPQPWTYDHLSTDSNCTS